MEARDANSFDEFVQERETSCSERSTSSRSIRDVSIIKHELNRGVRSCFEGTKEIATG